MSVPAKDDPQPPVEPAADADLAPASPDGFQLMARLPQVMRLSPKTLSVAGGVAGLAIGGALLWALRTQEPKTAQELYAVQNPNKSEVITGAVASYGNEPNIGPPVPGEQASDAPTGASDMAPVPGTAPPPADPRIAAAEQVRQRALQEREAAAASRLFLGASGGMPLREEPAEMAAAPTPGALSPPSKVSARRQFLEGGSSPQTESNARIVEAGSLYVLQAGAVIPAALISGIRSDLNVYDSPTGRVLLIPQGARLIGEYDSEVVAGQSRVLLAWDRLILPGGRSIRLDRQLGADASGYAGLEDRVDNHWGKMFRAALISSLLGVGGEVVSGGDSELVRALRSGVQDGTNEAGRRVVERELSVPPTLTIRPGFDFRVMVTRDIVLEPIETGGPQ